MYARPLQRRSNKCVNITWRDEERFLRLTVRDAVRSPGRDLSAIVWEIHCPHCPSGFFTQCVFSSALKSLHWIHRHCPRPEVCRGNLMRRTAAVQLQKHFMIHSVPCCILYAILLIFNTLDLARRQCQCVNYFYVYVEHSCSATWLHIVWSEVTKLCLKFGKCVDVFWVFCIMSLRFCHLFLYFCKYQHAVE